VSGRRTCTQCGARGHYPSIKGEQWFEPNKHDDGIVDICRKCVEESVNQFEYVTSTAGYTHCACLQCEDIATGVPEEALCRLCEDAGCEIMGDCQRDDIYE
jgi:hypothetical protein